MNIQRLSAVLARANSCPPMQFRAEFYEIKQHICETFGKLIGHDVQYIKKTCWGDYYEGCSDHCDRCGGTGIYSETWWKLERWKVGERVFHRPAQRLSRSEAVGYAVNIEGKISHKKTAKARDCAGALFLLFAPHRIAIPSIENQGACEHYRRAMRIACFVGPVTRKSLVVSQVEVPF